MSCSASSAAVPHKDEEHEENSWQPSLTSAVPLYSGSHKSFMSQYLKLLNDF